MDAGVAAIASGLVAMAGALGGAVVGGVAAVRGARIGAEKAAEASQTQLKSQASIDHGRWLQQQRIEAYSAFLDAWDAILPAISEVGGLENSPLSADDIRPVSIALHNLRSERRRVAILGPRRAERLADELLKAASQMERMLQMTEAELDALKDRDKLNGADLARMRSLSLFPVSHLRFLRLAGEVISQPPGLDEADAE